MAATGLAVLLGLVVLLGPAGRGPALAAAAPPSGRVWRIGLLMPERPWALEALGNGLRDLGYVEGRNMVLEVRRASAFGDFPRLADELLRLNPDVVVAVSGLATQALKAATRTVPIVMASSGDAVRQGLVASLARPGGNVTGLTFVSPELVAKRLQLLKEAAPRATRIGVIGCRREEDSVSAGQWAEVQPAARRMGLHLVPALVQRIEELPRAFAAARREKIGAVLVLDCSRLASDRVVGLVAEARLPALYPSPRYVHAGGLMSYAWNPEEQYRRAAAFVDRILGGARPADIPVEQPTRIELIVSLKAARILGLTLPPSLLSRADTVIQ